MLDDGKLYRPARRRLQPDPVHRNYMQREPFMYGSLLSDYIPRKRPSVHRERPLQECFLKRPPLPRERPISRSMVAEFLHKKRERERRPEEFHPQHVFGSRGGGLSRRCTSACGQRVRNNNNTAGRGFARRISVSAGGERKHFSMIQTLIDEVLPKTPSKPDQVSNKQNQAKQQKVQAWKFKEQPGSPIASPPKNWPCRPASAPFKLSPQNMSPVDLAETLAEKRRNFLRKRPATAPPTRPAFHLPLSRINNPRRSSTPGLAKPKAAFSTTTSTSSSSSGKTDHPSQPSPESSETGSSSSSADSHSPEVTTVTTSVESSGDDIGHEERRSLHNTPASKLSSVGSSPHLHNTPASNISSVNSPHLHNTPASRMSSARLHNTPASRLSTINSSSSGSSQSDDQVDDESSSSSSSTSSSDERSEQSSSSSCCSSEIRDLKW